MSSGAVSLLVEMSKEVRIFAGRADQGDATRFMFEYESGGQRGTVVGYMTADWALDFDVTLPASRHVNP